jgi:DNA-binding response OmpR family regulator
MLTSRVIQQCKIVNSIIILTSGEECIKYLKAEGEHQRRTLPCLMFLDLVMTPTGGIDVLRWLCKESDFGKHSLVVMLSGLGDLKLVQKGYQLGATTFLVKPLKIDDVLQMSESMRGLAVERVATGYLLSLRSDREKKICNGH